MNITVYLGANEGNDPGLRKAVEELGTWIGSSGNALVYGGSRSGLMGAIADSVLLSGGEVTGVEPRCFIENEFQHDGLTRLIVTEDMTERKRKMIELGDAFIAVPGGIVKSLIDLPDIICNLVIIALLILLSIFGVDLIIKASTVLSTAILIVTAILVIMGFVVPIDAVAQELATENAAYASIPAIADVTSQKGLEGVWRGVFVYAAFQCVSVPAMIAASTELTHKGVKRASILGWLMNGGALAASGAMLLRWYPILCAIKSTGVDTVASIAARHIGDVMKLPNQSVVTLMGSGYTWLFVVYTILLFCAFVSTSVTLVYSMIQRFEGHCFPKAIKSKAARSVIVGLIVIGLCYAVSLLGLSTIISKIYGYDGYYALIVVVLPAFIWGIPKIKKLSAEKKAELSE